MRASAVAAAEKIAAGDIDGALAHFIDAIDGQGAWRALPAYDKQELRDNAFTLLGQVNEQRPPFRRDEAEAIHVPTLLVGGARTRGHLPITLQALAEHIPGAKVEMIPKAMHFMFGQDPVRFCAAVLAFLAD
jgi:pimeloyl-ACP methyl ester carboxylesterase